MFFILTGENDIVNILVYDEINEGKSSDIVHLCHIMIKRFEIIDLQEQIIGL